jgi:hypothetical protein
MHIVDVTPFVVLIGAQFYDELASAAAKLESDLHDR